MLRTTYSTSKGQIEVVVDAAPIVLNVDNAVPLGLLINELVSNSLKHAFPAGRKGTIRIILACAQDNAVELVVRDDGRGIPPELDWQNTGSLGLKLVRILASQLKGELEFKSGHGSEFRLKFRANVRKS